MEFISGVKATWQVTPYAITALASAIVAAWLAIIVWRRRTVPGGRPLTLFMLAASEWALTSAFESAAVGIQAKIFWSKVAYLGTHSVPVLFLLFALQYTHHDKSRISTSNSHFLNI